MVEPTYFVDHYEVWWRMRDPTQSHVALCSSIKTGCDTRYGRFEVSCRIVWGIINHRNGRKFNFCHSLVVVSPASLPIELGIAWCDYWDRPRRIWQRGDQFISLPEPYWMKSVGQVASRIYYHWDFFPEVDPIWEWQRRRLVNALTGHV
jgi:hypothetical protein